MWSTKAPIPTIAMLAYASLVNAALGAFDLLPAFQLDRGRVFLILGRLSLVDETRGLISLKSCERYLSEQIADRIIQEILHRSAPPSRRALL